MSRFEVLNALEPARIRAVAAAIVALAASLGVTLPIDVDGWVTAIIAVVAVAVPLIQGEATRAVVFSPATHNAELGRVAAGLTNGPTED